MQTPTSTWEATFLSTIEQEQVGSEGMRIDRMFFDRFADEVRDNDFIAQAIEAGQWDRAIDYVNQEVFDKPEEYYTLAKLRQAAAVDRRVTLREILEKVFDLIPRFSPGRSCSKRSSPNLSPITSPTRPSLSRRLEHSSRRT